MSRTLLLLVLGLALQVHAAPAGEHRSPLLPKLGNETELMAADGKWYAPVMIWSYCCGDSTFTSDFVRNLGKWGTRIYPALGDDELLKFDDRANALKVAGFDQNTNPGEMVVKLTKAANDRGSAFMFTGDFNMDARAHDYFNDNYSPGMAGALKQSGVKIFSTYRNALDTLLCQVRDCMVAGDGVDWSWIVPVDQSGKEFPFGSQPGDANSGCFSRRFSPNPVLVKIKNFDAVWQHLSKNKVDMMNAQLKNHGLWSEMATQVEVLEGYEFEQTPGELTDTAVKAWQPLLASVGLDYSSSTIWQAMTQLMKKQGQVRVDEPYSWRLYAGKEGDADYRKKVEQLVEKFGYRRWPGDNKPLIDWSDKPQPTDVGNRHGLPGGGQGAKLAIGRWNMSIVPHWGDDESVWKPSA